MAWLNEHMKYLAVALGLLAGLPLIWRRRRELGLPKFWQTLLLAFGFSAASVAGAMLLALAEQLLHGQSPSIGAISLFGVFLIGAPLLLAAAALLRLPRPKLFDTFALYALPSLILMRINCLISGCCGGRAIGATGLTWPTREIEIIFYFVLLAVFFHREKTSGKRVNGDLFPLFMMIYGLFRFMEEFFREGSGLLHIAHLWSIISFAAGFSVYAEMHRRAEAAKKSGGKRKC